MSRATLPEVKQLASQLSAPDQLKLVEHVMQNLHASPRGGVPVSLRGIWKGKVPDDLNLTAVLHEIRTEWEKEWDEDGNFVG